MAREHKRIPVEGRGDLSAVADAVHEDQEPRVLEKDGMPIAAVVSMSDLERLNLSSTTPEGIDRALRAAGAWSDIDDDFIDRLYRARHESPPSPPVNL